MKKISSKLKAGVLASALCASVGSVSSAFGMADVDLGLTLGTDIATAKGLKFNNKTNVTVGGYARLWVKTAGRLTLAPFIKWENVAKMELGQVVNTVATNNRDNNLQYGLLLGVNISAFTPYIGMGYSHFANNGFHSTWALNYGVTFKIPLTPLVLGLDASWQQPYQNSKQVDNHRVAVTLGARF